MKGTSYLDLDLRVGDGCAGEPEVPEGIAHCVDLDLPARAGCAEVSEVHEVIARSLS